MQGEHDSLKEDFAQNDQSNKVASEPKNPIQKVKHMYLEEQNIYGRFIPYLLLKDQLHSQMDSSGNSALHHMCSHNSPYIPLYLSTIKPNDPILNRKSNMGHTPLDVAGLYCNKQYIECLKAKGAIDNGEVDHWSIQGGNLQNWSGQINKKKKFLIHWAGYNDLPQVIAQYYRCGVNLSEPDTNGYSAIDLAVINKSYKSIKVLAQFGERPQAQLIKNSDSVSIKQFFKDLNESDARKKAKSYLKLLTIPLFLSLSNYLMRSNIVCGTSLLCSLVWMYLLCSSTKAQAYMDGDRKTAFKSQLLLDKQINRTNHLGYLIFHFLLICSCLQSVIGCTVKNYGQAIIFWILIFVTISYTIHFVAQIYGITHNLTYSQMFNSHEWSHLWKEIAYIPQRQIVVRNFKNPYDAGMVSNLSSYL